MLGYDLKLGRRRGFSCKSAQRQVVESQVRLLTRPTRILERDLNLFHGKKEVPGKGLRFNVY